MHRSFAVVHACQFAILPRVHGRARKAGEVRALVGLAVLVGLVIVGGVRRVERHQQVERVLLLLPGKELQRVIGQQVSFEAMGRSGHAVDHEGRVLIGSAAARDGRPVVEAGLGLVVIAHVPLAAHAQRVAIAGEDLRVWREAGVPVARGRSVAIFGDQPVLHAVARGEGPGEIGDTAGRADRGAGEGARELCAAFGKCIDIRSLHLPATIGSSGPGSMIVRHEHDDIGPPSGAARGGVDGSGLN